MELYSIYFLCLGCFDQNFVQGFSYVCRQWYLVVLTATQYSIAWICHNLFFILLLMDVGFISSLRLLRMELPCPFLFFAHTCVYSNRLERKCWDTVWACVQRQEIIASFSRHLCHLFLLQFILTQLTKIWTLLLLSEQIL